MQKTTKLESALDSYSATARTTRSVGRAKKVKDWALYTAAAGSALAAAERAEAAIVYSGVQNIMVTRTATSFFQALPVDLNGDSLDDFELVLAANSTFANARVDVNSFAYLPLLLHLNNPDGPESVRRLDASFSVSSGAGLFDNDGVLRFVDTAGSELGLWPGGNPVSTTGFAAGFFFAVGGDRHFTWLRLALRNDGAGRPDKLTLIDWAYESVPDAPLHVGSVPEPSSLALLALGAAGVAAFRHRKRRGDQNAASDDASA